MSIRTAVHRLVQNGRIVLRSLQNKPYSNGYVYKRLNKIHVAQASESQNSLLCQNSGNVSSTSRHLGYLGTHARRIFVDNILKRVTNSLAADLRRRAASRLVFGDSAPFFALVGVSLASGTGILTKDNELDGVCWEIREAVSKLRWNMPQNDKNYKIISNEENTVTLQNFVIGPIIAKGCSAAVYAARFVDAKVEKNSNSINIDTEAKDKNTFPFAIKMMFNYNTESNAAAILRAMYRETVPSKNCCISNNITHWERKLIENKTILPSHPNIVAMYNVFADKIPILPDSWGMYPDALPTRINPHGSGRNMSLFLLMKRYDVTLKQYLVSRKVDMRVSILLLAQLLEAIAHMNVNGIVHRDLKSDNILLDLSEETDNCPSLVVTDFGCCLADKDYGLYLPYNTHDIDKGGNVALMAPEVITAIPGPFTKINYTKADLWTVGTIAYEIFGTKNPFYSENGEEVLKNYSYTESELPMLPENMPPIINAVIKNALSRSLYKRLDTQLAATIMQLYLWAPSSWLKNVVQLPTSNEIMQWLLCLTTKILCEGRSADFSSSHGLLSNSEYIDESNTYKQMNSTHPYGRRTMPEYQLIASFLSRITLGNIRNALKWIKQNV
ncbi:serine/threonine-protein kinase PINK1, mitochondrial [Harpegnathos saltator]|uniref:non-specific serine/threonine protein kinase n=1 Tax=Harpegnathos saltator TaxID=610380 RepID=E2C523_HARSA|nr:serine/threonine-protein kinase PINK1, mitochondrial [Harpegnathos saltator]XP_019700159.1 serine/threonine-protein kinase PINK1, mitochondrial [Harpegnathos saltator]XP_025162536.1 serine/threonine-protein kinase PINK1, mitochondrial [Harpegnathos saltator]EFN76957.1 Serine/threonine-protein kinase PINK1, mitochondrial [Harpegnathos saltator]